MKPLKTLKILALLLTFTGIAPLASRADLGPPVVVVSPQPTQEEQELIYYWTGFFSALSSPRDIPNQDWTPLIIQSEMLSNLFRFTDPLAAAYFRGAKLGWMRKQWVDQNPGG